MKKTTIDKNTFYSDPWFVKNTLFDVKYMSDLLAGMSSNGATVSTALQSKLNAELDTTIASNNTGTLLALLDKPSTIPSIHWGDAAEYLNKENQTDISENTDTINQRKSKRLECKKLGKTYFYGLDPDFLLSGCAGLWNTLATTDFSTST